MLPDSSFFTQNLIETRNVQVKDIHTHVDDCATVESEVFVSSTISDQTKELVQQKKKEMVIVLLRHFKQTQDFTSFPRQAIIAHQS